MLCAHSVWAGRRAPKLLLVSEDSEASELLPIFEDLAACPNARTCDFEQ
jgi:hypothetical protein